MTFRPKFQIPGAYFTICFVSVIAITNGYAVFFDFNISDFFAAYIILPIVFVLYIGHVLWYRNWKFFAPLEQIDCFTGLKEVEEDQETYVKPETDNWFTKFYY